MTKEQKGDFTRRITQANRSGLVVILYDMLFAYLEDARDASEKQEWGAFKEALRGGQKVINELLSVLNFKYELSKELYRIYVFCRDLLSKAMYRRSLEEVDQTERLMRKLYTSFVEVAKGDKSPVLMKNTQTVYAGFTYGRNNLTETYEGEYRSRGFLA